MSTEIFLKEQSELRFWNLRVISDQFFLIKWNTFYMSDPNFRFFFFEKWIQLLLFLRVLKCLHFSHVCSVTSVLSDSLWPYGLYPSRLLCPRDSPGKNTGVGCHALFHEIFLTQGSNLNLLHCRWIIYPLSHLL